MRKAEIVLRHYDGALRPVVNVKIHAVRRDFINVVRKVAVDNGATDGGEAFATWFETFDDADGGWWDEAIRDAWEQLQNDIEGEDVFTGKQTVTSYGRSGGWAGIDGFTEDDVASWDAIAVARWAKFARFARETADDVPYQYLSLLYLNPFERAQTEQATIAAFCADM